MCGIVYYHNLRGKNVSHQVIKRYKQQEDRGKEGFGVYLPEKDTLIHQPKERKMLKTMRKINTSIALFHHRWPTSTDNVRNSCHPFSTKDFFKTNYILVHNGVLSNEYELRRKHEKMGIKYISGQTDGRFNDSESLLWEVALYLEGKNKDIEARGSIAFICYAKGSDTKLYFGRNGGSPLKLSVNKNDINIASEGLGIEDILENTLYEYNYATNALSTKPCIFPRYLYTPPAQTVVASHNYSSYGEGWKGATNSRVAETVASRQLRMAESKTTAEKIAAHYINEAQGLFVVAFENLMADMDILDNGSFGSSSEIYSLGELEDAGTVILDEWDKAGNKNNSIHESWADFQEEERELGGNIKLLSEGALA